MTAGAAPLECVACARPHPAGERFCVACGMPLVFVGDAGEVDASPAHERARKVNKRYLEGPLVRVATGRHQAEAELIMGLLLEEGVPSMSRRSAGFDVPDMMFAGPRDIMVPESGAEAARELLGQAERAHAERRAAEDRATIPQPDDAAGRRAARPQRRVGRPTRTMAIVVSGTLAVASLAPVVVWVSRVT